MIAFVVGYIAAALTGMVVANAVFNDGMDAIELFGISMPIEIAVGLLVYVIVSQF